MSLCSPHASRGRRLRTSDRKPGCTLCISSQREFRPGSECLSLARVEAAGVGAGDCTISFQVTLPQPLSREAVGKPWETATVGAASDWGLWGKNVQCAALGHSRLLPQRRQDQGWDTASLRPDFTWMHSLGSAWTPHLCRDEGHLPLAGKQRQVHSIQGRVTADTSSQPFASSVARLLLTFATNAKKPTAALEEEKLGPGFVAGGESGAGKRPREPPGHHQAQGPEKTGVFAGTESQRLRFGRRLCPLGCTDVPRGKGGAGTTGATLSWLRGGEGSGPRAHNWCRGRARPGT